MFKTLSQAMGFALSMVTVIGTAHAEIELPDQCWPNCQDQQALFNQECQNAFGSLWYYCGYSDGWVYCCGGE